MKNVTYISASAGSGKTFTLTEKLKEAICNNSCKPEEVILTTFTDLAASEFREKAKAKLYEAGKTKEANRLDQALIGTIDSIANTFVKRHWYLLGLSPNMNPISGKRESVYISESLSGLMSEEQKEFFNKFAETFKIRYSYRDRESGINYDFWKDGLKKVLEKTRYYEIKDYTDSINESKKFVESITTDDCSIKKDEIVNYFETIKDIAREKDSKSSKARDTRIKKIEEFEKILNDKNSSNLEIGITLDDLLGSVKNFKAYSNSSDFENLKEVSDKFWTERDVRNCLFAYVDNIFEIAKQWLDAYSKYKKEQHIIDFTDMEEFFLKLLTEEKYKTIQDDISKTYKYLFVDEFQDSSPMQIKIFDRLSDLVESTIWVGDYKQSIYGFRGSAPELVRAITSRIENHETLTTSYRSWPPIVDVVNSIFVDIFKGTLNEDEVRLKYSDKRDKEWEDSGRDCDCLKVWPFEKKDQIAANIAKMIRDGVAPKDIAVLAFKNDDLKNLSLELKKYNIPTCIKDESFKENNEIILLTSLLNLIIDPSNAYSRAQIAYLTEKGYCTARILDERFDHRLNMKKSLEYLENIPLIKKLMDKRDEYNSLNIASLVESIIIEMDLYNVVSSWPESDNSVDILHAAIKTAQEYEENCKQMCLSCTISGFVDYILTEGIKCDGSRDGVQLVTYHSSKGLEWKNVILLSLGDDIAKDDKIIKNNVYDVRDFYREEPSKENPYPARVISALPNIFGLKNIPEHVNNLILNNARYEEIKKAHIEEEKRLMYVAMTRPIERLIFTVEIKKEKIQLSRLKGIDVKVINKLPEEQFCDVLNIEKKFSIEKSEDIDINDWKFKIPERKIINHYGEKKEYKKRDQQPSSYVSDEIINPKIVLDTGKRIKIHDSNVEMDKVGDCIHDIFCVVEINRNKEFLNNIIKEHQMHNVLEVLEVIEAWDCLEKFLSGVYGSKVSSYHELPFKQQIEGQIFTGSIDLIWETKDGVVLVDYKSYPGSKADVVNPQHAHYSGIYTGQFKCYERALIESGKKVISKLIFYHTLGVVVEF